MCSIVERCLQKLIYRLHVLHNLRTIPVEDYSNTVLRLCFFYMQWWYVVFIYKLSTLMIFKSVLSWVHENKLQISLFAKLFFFASLAKHLFFGPINVKLMRNSLSQCIEEMNQRRENAIIVGRQARGHVLYSSYEQRRVVSKHLRHQNL